MGRMGNQMFQYACAKELSEYNGFVTSLSHLDKIDHFELAPFERSKNRLKSFLFFRLWKKIWGLEVINTELSCLQRSFKAELDEITKPTSVWGFFQSPLYFQHLGSKLNKYFSVKAKFRQHFHAFLSEHHLKPGAYLAIHIRRTDYQGFTVPGLQGDDFTLPTTYYKNALQQLGTAHHLPIVFVSDAPDSVPNLFPEIEAKIISHNDAITDFLILQHASKIIISNSTYAWWAAFLNEYVVNEVYCPKFFLGFKEDKEVPINIFPDHWQQIDVY